jgi:ABC-type multidrug transport system fused ATPase/permease subunit
LNIGKEISLKYIEDGTIIESGSFAELVKIPNGKFKRLWERQVL